jgi:predicted phage terminase large subunit-like protein
MRLLDFAKLARPSFSFDWFQVLLLDLLERCAERDPEVPNLLISMPPGSGKSTCVMELFAAWLIVHNPLKEKVIALSAMDNLARQACSNVLRILHLPEVEDRFPLAFDKETENQFTIEGSDSGRPAMYAASIMGSVTGQRASLLLWDDLVKNLEVAYSQDQLDKIWENFQAVAETRLIPGAPIIGISTRWTLKDPTQRLMDLATSNPAARQFVYVNLAAWNTGEDSFILDTRTGKQTFLPRYKALAKVQGQPYSFSREQLESKRASLGPNLWSALYMGSPISGDGQLFPPDSWGCYDGVNHDELDLVVTSWDFASKTGSSNDWTANCVLARTSDGRILVLDVFKTKVDFSQLPGLVLVRWQGCSQKYKTVPALVCEDSSSGTQVIQLFQSSQPQVPLVAAKPTKSKVIRAEGVTPVTRSGLVCLPRNAPWLEPFISELAQFPAGKHDDVVDCFVHGMKAFLSGGDFKATKFLLQPGRQQTENELIAAEIEAVMDEQIGCVIAPDLDAFDRGNW